jgi:hypothetical protein
LKEFGMGFSTIYLRSFKLNRPLTPDHADILMEFHDTEHGIEDEEDPASLYKPETYYCQWIPTEDWAGIEWDGIEKFYRSKEWLVYLQRFPGLCSTVAAIGKPVAKMLGIHQI